MQQEKAPTEAGALNSIKADHLVGKLINAAGQILTGLAGDVDEVQGRALAEVLRPLGIVSLTIAPHGLQSRVSLGGLVQPGEDGGDAEEHEQLMLHVLLVLAHGQRVQIHGLETSLGDLDMMGVTAAGDVILDGLALPADGGESAGATPSQGGGARWRPKGSGGENRGLFLWLRE